MSDTWVAIRAAIATKVGASSGCATAGLKSSSADVDAPLSTLPAFRVLQPAYALEWQTGVQERYTLDIPFEVIVNRPAGRHRSEPVGAAIARALQVEFQSGYLMAMDLGLASLDALSILSMEPGLVQYDEQDTEGNPRWDGYRGVIRAGVLESVTRTA